MKKNRPYNQNETISIPFEEGISRVEKRVEGLSGLLDEVSGKKCLADLCDKSLPDGSMWPSMDSNSSRDDLGER